MRYVFRILGLFLFSSLLFAEPLRVGVYHNPPKIGFDKDQTVYGFYIDLLEHFAEEGEWEFEYITGTWEECFFWLQNGQIDILPDVTYSEERDAFLDFNKYPILSYWVEIFYRRNLGINKFEDLQGRRLGVLKGSYQEDLIRQRVEDLDMGVDILSLDSFQQIHQFLVEGLIDAGTLERYSAYLDDFSFLDETSLVIDLMTVHFAVAEGRFPRLLQIIDLSMADAIKDSDSFYFSAVNNWLDDRSAYRIPLELIIVLVVIAGLAVISLLVVLLFRLKLNRKTAELQSKNAELKHLNLALDRDRAELKAAAQEREVLVRELFHRIGNNLGTISSFISLKALQLDTPEVRRFSEDFKFYIVSQAIVHQQLYLSGDLSRISLNTYLEHLIHDFCRKAGEGEDFPLQLKSDPLTTVIDLALPFGMVVIEMIQNARKYALPQGGSFISLVLKNEGEKLCFEYRDDGPGLPEGAFSTSLGLGLMKELVENQLLGELLYWNDEGLHYRMTLPTNIYQERI